MTDNQIDIDIRRRLDTLFRGRCDQSKFDILDGSMVDVTVDLMVQPVSMIEYIPTWESALGVKIGTLIGSGTYNEVYECIDESGNRMAVRLSKRFTEIDDEFFLEESTYRHMSEIKSGLEIYKYHALVCEDDDEILVGLKGLVMELGDDSLFTILKHPQNYPNLNVLELADCVFQNIQRAANSLHLLMDIKPANIIVKKGEVFFIDFDKKFLVSGESFLYEISDAIVEELVTDRQNIITVLSSVWTRVMIYQLVSMIRKFNTNTNTNTNKDEESYDEKSVDTQKNLNKFIARLQKKARGVRVENKLGDHIARTILMSCDNKPYKTYFGTTMYNDKKLVKYITS